MKVYGCLACQQPVEVGARGDERFVTLKAPTTGAGSLRAATEIASAVVPFADAVASEAWVKALRRQVRTEFLFQPGGGTWTLGRSRGVAFRLVGVRVANACTGDVIFADPPSKGPAARVEGDGEACRAGDDAAAAGDDPGGETTGGDLPQQLSATLINQTLGGVRAQFDSCFARIPVRGSAILVLVVAGNGAVRSVAVEGGVAGTALASCLAGEAGKIRFPRFREAQQKFRYPLVRKG
jgi:hypothetical protein